MHVRVRMYTLLRKELVVFGLVHTTKLDNGKNDDDDDLHLLHAFSSLSPWTLVKLYIIYTTTTTENNEGVKTE